MKKRWQNLIEGQGGCSQGGFGAKIFNLLRFLTLKFKLLLNTTTKAPGWRWHVDATHGRHMDG